MNSLTLIAFAIIAASAAGNASAAPVYTDVKEFTIDTTKYRFTNYDVLSGPNSNWAATSFMALFNKESNKIDLFYFGVQCGSITVPNYQGDQKTVFKFSRYFIDDDDGWEFIMETEYPNKTYGIYVYDDNGAEIISEKVPFTLEYGFDGKNTYVIGYANNKYKYWRFRTDITNSGNGLSKQGVKSSQSMMRISGNAGGSYRINLLPSASGKTLIELFDLSGRRVFSKQIDKGTLPVSFTIPEHNVPRSPFIAKARNKEGVSVLQGISEP